MVTVLDVVTAAQAHQNTIILDALLFPFFGYFKRRNSLISVLMNPYNDVPQEEAGRHLDEDVVDPLSGLPSLLPVLQPGLVAGGLNDLLVALSQLLHVVTCRLHCKLRDVQPEVQMVHWGSLFVNRYLGRDGSRTRMLF